MELEIEKTLVASTGHVLQEDMTLLEIENSYPYTVFNNEYGAMIYIVKDMYIPVEHSEEFITEGGHDIALILKFSKDFRRLLKIARDNDCTWLRLDSDGSEIEGLPIHEW